VADDDDENVYDDLQGQLTLFDEPSAPKPSSPSAKPEGEAPPFRLSKTHQAAIRGYLADGIQSVRMICELLIRDHHAPDARFVTGKPLFYVDVCRCIETLPVTLVQGDRGDRFYALSVEGSA